MWVFLCRKKARSTRRRGAVHRYREGHGSAYYPVCKIPCDNYVFVTERERTLRVLRTLGSKLLIVDWSELAKRPDVRLGIERLLQFIRDFVGDTEFEKGQDGIFSYDHIGETFGKFAINSFTITDDNFNDLGCGIYLSGSVFDHSCWPNASKYFVGKDLHVYAIRQIGSIKEVRCVFLPR